ncbi:MAG: FAD-binding oxidoreductase [Gemmatimonadales bacterium]
MRSGAIFDLLRRTLGGDAVELDPEGLPRALPPATDAVAALCGMAHQRGLRVRIEGGGTWMAADAPADFAISTRTLNRIREISASGQFAAVDAGVALNRLHRELGSQGLWLPLDPPGLPERTVGSVVATGTGGPCRHGFGPVGSQVQSLTLVTGDGRVMPVDLAAPGTRPGPVPLGSFGAFGVIAEVRFRLVPLPETRMVLVAVGERDVLTRQARELMEEGVAAITLELLSPAGPGAEWTLVLELAGTRESVDIEVLRADARSEVAWTRLFPDEAGRLQSAAALAALAGPVTLRIGGLPDGLDDMLDLVEIRLGLDVVSAGAGRGTLRWSGEPGIAALRELRHGCAVREVPVTLERGPWDLRRTLGHFGAYHEGPGLGDAAPDPTFAVVLEAAPG